MHFKTLFLCLCSLAALALHTSAWSVVLSARGDAGKPSSNQPRGVFGMALGVDPSTPRNGATIDPHMRDATIFNQRAMKSWKGCGSTIQLGVLNVNAMTTKLVQNRQIAQVSPGGFLYMVLHQITGGGNGPYDCGIDRTGAGTSYSPLTVTVQVPGASPVTNSVRLTPFSLNVAMPAGLKCTGSYGGMNNICMVRCQNFANNGPYGACIPVQVVNYVVPDDF